VKESETEGKETVIETSGDGEKTEKPGWKSQVLGLVTLLPVLGLLWLALTWTPKLGDWMGSKADWILGEESMAEDETVGAVPGETNPLLADPPGESTEPESGEKSPPEKPGPGDSMVVGFRSQIVEQLGGAGRVEVRHLALSEDEARMVAALKLLDSDGKSELVEVFFEQDEFGRFHSVEYSPIEKPVKLWSE
jgi:hypothetical protein